MTTRSLFLFALLSPCLVVRAPAEDNDLRDKLDKMPQPWRERIHRLTAREYEATLDYWAKEYPKRVTVEVAGNSLEKVPIYLLKVTDGTIDATDKQICLITSLHGGPERSGTTTVLHLIEWLLGESAEAEKVRRRQIVLLMPIVNPYAFFETDRFGNSQGIDPYTGGGPQNWDLATLSFKALEKSPEIRAFLDVVDRFQPEVHMDLHGTGLQEYSPDRLGDRTRYHGQTMFEVTGSAYSNYALRPWDWRVTEAMIRAGTDAGFPSDRFEADAQRAYWGPVMQPVAGRLWLGRPNFYTAQYAYAKYHTMLAALEIGWEESGVVRTQGLLNIGNRRWQDEIFSGYPVHRVKSFIGHYVTVWGRNASERRRSRVELWPKQTAFTQAVLYPQTDGRDMYVTAVNQQAAEMLDEDPTKFVDNLRQHGEFQADAIKTFVDAGPEIKLAVRKAPPSVTEQKIQHGLGLRLRLPYQKPKLVDVRLNGHLLPEDPLDGYQSWLGNGFTQVQINVPPEKAQNMSLYVVTCAYTPEVTRRYGWTPPSEVVDALRAEKK